MIGITYYVASTRIKVARLGSVWGVWRKDACIAAFRVHADAIAWADRKARGRA